MPFSLKWAPEATVTFERLKSEAQSAKESRGRSANTKSSKQEGLFKQVAKTVSLLREDPRHPGLNTHEYSSLTHPYDPKKKVFGAYVQNRTPGAYRLFWCYGPARNDITIMSITPHP